MTNRPVVAIDGPAGAGKSTVARALATELGFDMLDTGAMYRAVTLAVLEAGVPPADTDAVAGVLATVDIEVGTTTRLNGRDVSGEIRTPAVSAAVSTVSAHRAVRTALIEWQRAWAAARRGAVAEGRDMATVVFPDARLKVFLTASANERAQRRQRDEESAHRASSLQATKDALAARDAADHETNPLVPAPGALTVDTTGRTVEDIVEEIAAAYRSCDER